MRPKLYHNPRCSKSRQALHLLKTSGIDFDIALYIKDGIEADEVVELSKKLHMYPSEFIRKGEPVYKDIGGNDFSLEEWSAIIEQHPILLQRPILVTQTAAIIGRPPELVLSII